MPRERTSPWSAEELGAFRGYNACVSVAPPNPPGGQAAGHPPSPASCAGAFVDGDGLLRDALVLKALRPAIERGKLTAIRGIVVHQTGGATAKSALEAYQQKGANGAHFLIDKDGTIYQTASLLRFTQHVGHLKSRCMAELRCSPEALATLKLAQPGRPTGRIEARKDWPDRFPGNQDSVGIELVGRAILNPNVKGEVYEFEPVTEPQQVSLKRLIDLLKSAFAVKATEIYRHPDLSWKQPSEASTARW